MFSKALISFILAMTCFASVSQAYDCMADSTTQDFNNAMALKTSVDLGEPILASYTPKIISGARWMKHCRPTWYAKYNPSRYLFPDSNIWEDQTFIDPTSMEVFGWGVSVVNDEGYRMSLMCASDNMAELLFKMDMTDSKFTTDFDIIKQYQDQISVGLSFDRSRKEQTTEEEWIVESGDRKVISTSLDSDRVKDHEIIDALKAKRSHQFFVHIEGASGKVIDTEFSLNGSRQAIESLLEKCGLEEKN